MNCRWIIRPRVIFFLREVGLCRKNLHSSYTVSERFYLCLRKGSGFFLTVEARGGLMERRKGEDMEFNQLQSDYIHIYSTTTSKNTHKEGNKVAATCPKRESSEAQTQVT